MRTLLASLTVLMSVVNMAHAQTDGDPAAGRDKAQVCAACHGANGISAVPMFPNLAGQQAEYLTKQLADIRDGQRAVPQMAAIVANLNDQDIADLGAYFASQEPNLGQADPELATEGRDIYRAGNLASNLPACSACHTPTGAGIGSAKFPALSGQHPEYTVATLQHFAAGERSNDPNGIMRDIAAKMSDAQMQAVANYLYGLH